jgi:hypothetical protein
MHHPAYIPRTGSGAQREPWAPAAALGMTEVGIESVALDPKPGPPAAALGMTEIEVSLHSVQYSSKWGHSLRGASGDVPGCIQMPENDRKL